MEEIRVQYEHWMNCHSDDWQVRTTWRGLEKILENMPETEHLKLEQKFCNYLRHLEYQAYAAGFSAAIRLSAECFRRL